MKQIDYKIVHAESYTSLEIKVRSLMKEGWLTAGGIAFNTDFPSGRVFLYQTMVKYDL